MTQTALPSSAANSRQPQEPTRIARAVIAFVRCVRRVRWHTAPLWVGAMVWVVGYTTAPAGVAFVLALVGGLAYRWREPSGVRRKWLSRRERLALSWWATGAMVWALTELVWALPPRASVGMFAALTAWPAVRWATSRRVRPPRLDADLRALVARWDAEVAVRGSEVHRGSRVIAGTVQGTEMGGAVFDVQLADDVHSSDATAEPGRRSAEAVIRLPVGTLNLTVIRADATTMRVALNPHREMEAETGIPWKGPRLESDGTIPMAVTLRGESVGPQAFDQDGVKHMWINGATGSGKSTTTALVLLPPVLERREILLYIDGGRGTSLPPELAPLMTIIATTPEEWRQTIRIFGAITDARQESRYGITRWRGVEEPYPAIRLVIDEAPTVARAVTAWDHAIVARGGQAGRKVGMAVTQITLGTNADMLLGGTDWRSNATQVIAHRPGAAENSRKAQTSSEIEVDLLKLPPGPGWHAQINTGRVTFPARSEFATWEEIGAHTDEFEASQFKGVDSSTVRALMEEASAPAADEGPDEPGARDRVVQLIRAHGSITLADIAPTDATSPHATCDTAGCPGWVLKRRQTSTHLTALGGEGILGKEGTSWVVV